MNSPVVGFFSKLLPFGAWVSALMFNNPMALELAQMLWPVSSVSKRALSAEIASSHWRGESMPLR
ncbi:hypothetical protein D3C84_885520 [compost metagenome]